MSTISRRHLLAAGSAIVGAGMLPSAVRAQQLRQINFITPLNYLIGYAPSLNAQAGGHFKKEGLDVTILPGQGIRSRGATGDRRTRPLRPRRSPRNGKGDRPGRTDHRLRDDRASLADHGL